MQKSLHTDSLSVGKHLKSSKTSGREFLTIAQTCKHCQQQKNSNKRTQTFLPSVPLRYWPTFSNLLSQELAAELTDRVYDRPSDRLARPLQPAISQPPDVPAAGGAGGATVTAVPGITRQSRPRENCATLSGEQDQSGRTPTCTAADGVACCA